jgi:plastocyanin
MKRKTLALTAAALVALTLLAPAAGAKERVLTLYSPKINSLPYVHATHTVTLDADGREAPAVPGYITGWKEQALVDSKNPKAKPLARAKMMVHHFLYFAPGRVDEAPGGCWSGAGFIGGRGEEHPLGRLLRQPDPRFRARYGINNRKADGSAPSWRLTAMVMNHYKRPKSFYVRTRIHYTTEKRQSVMPLVIGKCGQLANGMAYDVPGGGRRGSNFVDQSDWVAPFNGRLLMAASHQHGGGKYQTLSSLTCKRRLFKAPVYHGLPNHVYNTIRPILHEPGPIGTGTYGTGKGIPIAKGEVLRRVAVHDNHNLHVASMGFWVTGFVEDDSVKKCGPIPRDTVELNRPRRFDRTPNHDLVVPQLAKPSGAFTAFDGNSLEVGDGFFRPGRITAKVGQTVTWSFGGSQPHSVTVANGPRGFSSIYWGRTRGTYSVTPTVRGTYRLTCLVHPTTMAQTLKVE